jgi:hypothetical protein
MADSPATPQPITNAFAGGNFPAAVIYYFGQRWKHPSASTTARYPAMFPIELSESSFYARVILGTLSIDTTVKSWYRLLSYCISSRF